MSATNRGSQRISQDAYNTPQDVISTFLHFVNFAKVYDFCEPCKGSGNIYDAIPNGYIHPRLPGMNHVIKKDYCEISQGKDYLKTVFEKRKDLSDPVLSEKSFDLIVTNPPFSLAKEFLTKSLSEALTVCYLLRLNFLGSQGWKAWWQKIGLPNKLLVLSKRPSFIPDKKGSTDATEYAWFCYDKQHIITVPDGIHVI